MDKPKDVTITDITPAPSERLLIVGASGSGKTTLARAMLPAFEHIIAIDPLGMLGSDGKPGNHLEGFKLVRSPEEVMKYGNQKTLSGKMKHPWIQYRPGPQYDHWTHYDRVFEYVLLRGNTLLYNDEAYRVMRGRIAPTYLMACMTGGRQKGVGMISCTQRPTGIDLRLISESEHLACFRLRYSADRKRMAEQMDEIVFSRPARDFGFWYMRDGDDKPRFLRLPKEA